MRLRPLLLPAVLMIVVAPIGGQTPGTIDPSLLSGVTLRAIGPTSVGGRIDDIAVGHTPGRPDAVYVASASGGVFKSVNGGVTWAPVFDKVDAMMSIGAIAVSKSNPNVVWVGTGEANTRQSSSWGDGVYKSTDAGVTWKRMGLVETRSIGRIVIDPLNPDVVYVAAQGHLFGPNPERGVFKTTDGGASWKQTLTINENTGANDVAIDPGNSKVLYAAAYQRERKSWGFNGGGPGSGIYRSTDSGVTWKKLTAGLPSGDMGRISFDIYKGSGKTDPTMVYAIVEASTGGGGRGGRGGAGGAGAAGGGRGAGAAGAGAAGAGAEPAAPQPPAGESGLYRSIDGGEHWERLSPLNTRPNYYSQIRVDPKDRNRLYELGSNRGFYLSDDGGKTFKDIFQGVPGQSLIHGEDHALWVDPNDPNHLIIGGDGGVSVSWDRGLSWDFRNNIPVAQFYEIDVDNKVPYTVCGGLQDNGEWCIPSAVRDRNGIANRDSWNIGGGDGFYVKFDRSDENYAYAESQNGNASRVNLVTLERTTARPGGGRGGGAPAAGAGQGAAAAAPAAALRFNWDTPIEVSHFDPRVVYVGAQMVFRSADNGATWTAISPDLTTGIDPATLPIMGAPVAPNALSRNDGTSPFASLTSIGESPMDAKVIYAGAQDGSVQITRDGGKTWTNLSKNFPGLPQYTYCSTVLPSRYAAGRVYATFDGHYSDDYKPYVYVSDDYGQTWRAIVSGLPSTGVNRIREHPSDAHFLVLGHERGVHFSTDDGRTWTSLSLLTNFPTVSADDLVIHPRDNALVIGTHGRGIWILDDVGVLQVLTPQNLASDGALAPMGTAHQIITHNVQAWYGAQEFFAPNPNFDADINYYLRSAASGQATIEVSDIYGTKVRTMTGPAAKGINHAAWDLRGDPPAAPAGQAAGGAGGRGGGGGGRGGGPAGPLVAPGRYVVVVKVPGLARELRGEVTVEADPIKR